jgi:CBS domain-containing protein
VQSERSPIEAFLATVHPYDSLPQDELARVARSFSRRHLAEGVEIYTLGDPLSGIFLVESGGVEILDRNGALVSLLGPRNTFGERGLMRDGLAVTTARTTEESHLLMLPAAVFRRLIAESPAFQRFFSRGRVTDSRPVELTARKVGELMARNPITCQGTASVREVAQQMRESHVSSVGVTAAAFASLATTPLSTMR